MTVLFLIVVQLTSLKRGFETSKQKAAKPKEVLVASKDALLAILLPIIIIGGIRFGVFSPTEAGAIAVVYALFFRFCDLPEDEWKTAIRSIKRICQPDSINYDYYCSRQCLWLDPNTRTNTTSLNTLGDRIH